MKECLTAALAALVLVLSSLSVQAQETKRLPSVHAALWHWLRGNREAALLVVRQSVPPVLSRPGAARGATAALRNIGARILHERYDRLRAAQPDNALEALREAEIFAAAAVWEEPYDLTYWRDYVRIATDQRAHRGGSRRLSDEEALDRLRQDLIRRELRYPDLGKRFAFTGHDEIRHVGHAMIRERQGDVLDAQNILASWVGEPRGRTRCIAAAVLVELQLDVHQFAAATERVDEFVRMCRGSSVGDILRARSELLTPQPGVSRGAETAWRDLPRVEDAIDVEATTPYDLADRLLRDPARTSDWNALVDKAATDTTVSEIFEQLVERLSERYGGDLPPAARRARAFRLLEAGRFEEARRELQTLLERDRQRAGADVLIAAVLIDTDESMEPHNHSRTRLLQAQEADPHLAACINSYQVELCLRRDRRCALAAILCADARELVYEFWSRGWKQRPKATLQLAKQVDGLVHRVRLNEELMREADARLTQQVENVEEQVAAVASTIDLIVEVQLPDIIDELQTKVSKFDLTDAIRKAEAKLRRDVNQQLRQQANDLAIVRAIAEQANVTSAEAARMASAVAVDVQTLKAFTPQLPDLLQPATPEIGADIKSQLQPIVEGVDDLRKQVRELQTPDFMANLEVLQDLEAASWPEIAYATAHIFDNIVEIATKPGKTILQVSKLIARGADFVKQRYLEKKDGEQ